MNELLFLQAEWYIDSSQPPNDWPDEGKIAFENYSTRYRPGLDLVLRGVTASVHPREKIGIVGRSGRATGYHVHYEVHVDGRSRNPLEFILDRRSR